MLLSRSTLVLSHSRLRVRENRVYDSGLRVSHLSLPCRILYPFWVLLSFFDTFSCLFHKGILPVLGYDYLNLIFLLVLHW